MWFWQTCKLFNFWRRSSVLERTLLEKSWTWKNDSFVLTSLRTYVTVIKVTEPFLQNHRCYPSIRSDIHKTFNGVDLGGYFVVCVKNKYLKRFSYWEAILMKFFRSWTLFPNCCVRQISVATQYCICKIKINS